MEKLRLSFIILVAFGFLCRVDSNPLSSLFGKSDDKAEAEDKEAVTTAKTAGEATTTSTTTTTTTTTATPEPSSSCGGLKGFLHLCEKSEPTEPPKSVKVRSVPEEDDEDSDSDSDENSNEEEEEKKDVTETSSVVSEPTEGVAKRQVGDSEAPILGEVPPVVGDAMFPPIVPSEGEDETVDKRQVDNSGDEEKTDEVVEVSRKRRDCRDRDGDYVKDCRKKREYVPCLGTQCGGEEATTEIQLK